MLNTGVVTTAMLNTVANRTVNGMYAQPINYPNQIINNTEPNIVNNYDPESYIYFNSNTSGPLSTCHCQ